MEAQIYADRARALPVTDPFGRELMISCGAALFHLRLALNYFGYAPKVEIFPAASEPDLVARVHLGLKSETDAETIMLFSAIVNRRTNRQIFRDQAIPDELLEQLEGAAQAEGAWLQVLRDESSRIVAADMIAQGDRMQWADKQFRQELAAWVRPADSASRDGLSIASQDLGALMSHAGPFCIRTFDLGKGHAARDREIALYSPVLAVLGTEGDDPGAWLAAGQALARVLLRGQAEDVCASFLNQPIQVADLRPTVGQIAGRPGFPQVLLRMGYGDLVHASRRRPLNEVLLQHADAAAQGWTAAAQPPGGPLDPSA
jgi:hypothetical protein